MGKKYSQQFTKRKKSPFIAFLGMVRPAKPANSRICLIKLHGIIHHLWRAQPRKKKNNKKEQPGGKLPTATVLFRPNGYTEKQKHQPKK